MAYLPLSTANLPDPAIDPAAGKEPADYFSTVLYTGTGADQAITGVGFQPDWTWLKMRSSTGSHGLFDSVRGATKRLSSNLSASEDTAAGVNSFDSDGFTLDALNWNDSGQTFVAWNWKAGGTAVSNTNGSITSSVSANTTAGMSIVSYSGNGSAGATIGHGLSAKPEMFWVKNRDRSAQWSVYHKALGATKFVELSTTAAAASDTPTFNDTEPTATVFSVGTGNGTNASGEDLIAFCFHSVDGFSKLGSYTGNGSSDGPFVYTGFRPAFVLGKNTTNAGNHWFIVDQERTTYNGGANWIKADDSAAELTNLTNPDFLSNGFKIRSSDAIYNTSGSTFIYMAFAENPFKYSNAR